MDLSQIQTVVMTIPVVCLLIIFVFRLDVLIFRSPARQDDRKGPRRFANYEGALTDPDGRVPVPVRGRSNSPYKHL